MRKNPTKEIERYRVVHGPMASTFDDGANGAFMIPKFGVTLGVIASDGTGWDMELPVWEHVSVSVRSRTPTWGEMDFIKRIFWRDDETVLQLHVPRDRHINFHEFCLHLWKPIGVEIPLPPMETVGPPP